MHAFSILLVRLIVGAVWVVAGLAKLAQRKRLGQAVAAFNLLPRAVADVVGRTLPWVELTLGALLLLGKWMAPAALASAGLLALFSLGIIINLVRGRDIRCNCFGQIGRGKISWLSVVRNLGLLAATLVIVVVRSDYLTLEGWQKGTALLPTDPPLRDFVPVLMLAVAGALIWVLSVSAWQVARTIAKADDGPALGLPERKYMRREPLRRWMGLQ